MASSHASSHPSRRRRRPARIDARALGVLTLRCVWAAVILWSEAGTFYAQVFGCKWPDAQLRKNGAASITRVLLVADPQVLDARSYPGRSAPAMYLTQKLVDQYLRKSFRTVLKQNPDVIIFLGDMLDGGRFALDDAEYAAYHARFREIFRVPEGHRAPKVHYLPGNHDVGLGGPDASYSAKAREHFRATYGPINSVKSIGEHSFIFLDAPGLVEEDYRRFALGELFDGSYPGVEGGAIEFIMKLRQDLPPAPRILLSHIPLWRPNLAACGPQREHAHGIHQGTGLGYQNLLLHDTSTFVLDSLKPDLIFSGDDHDYCDTRHQSTTGLPEGVREITVKSFSMAMGIQQPGYQLLSLAPPFADATLPTHSTTPCALPSELFILSAIYAPLAALSILFLLINHLRLAFSSRSSPLCSSSTQKSKRPRGVHLAQLKTGAPPRPRTTFAPVITRRSSGLVSPATSMPPSDTEPDYDDLEAGAGPMSPGVGGGGHYFFGPGSSIRYTTPYSSEGEYDHTSLDSPSEYLSPVDLPSPSYARTPLRIRRVSRLGTFGGSSSASSSPSFLSSVCANPTIQRYLLRPARNACIAVGGKHVVHVWRLAGGADGVLGRWARDTWDVLWVALALYALLWAWFAF